MNKHVLAFSAAAALAVPGVALAQASSVTISGYFMVGVENLSYSNSPATRLNKSQTRLVDNSSQIRFNVTENVGTDLSAIGQFDLRFDPTQASTAPTSNPIGSGNNWVGLRSKTWGTMTLGRHDLHYGKAGDDNYWIGGALDSVTVALFDYIGQTSIANVSRTQNSVKYVSPSVNGFAATVAWSANPIGNTEADMINPAPAGGSSRKGNGWNINPTYVNGPLNIGYSYWKAKPDAPVVATNDQRGDSLYGAYRFGAFKIGLGWNKSRLNNANTGLKFQERSTWSLPMSYSWGPHHIAGHYTKASNIRSDVAGVVTTGTGARMFAVTYGYALSKRTWLALSYVKLNNDANINYNLFSSASLGSSDTVTANGESPRALQATIKHSF